MFYSLYYEMSYFDGFAFAHIAAWEEAARLKHIKNYALKALGASR